MKMSSSSSLSPQKETPDDPNGSKDLDDPLVTEDA